MPCDNCARLESENAAQAKELAGLRERVSRIQGIAARWAPREMELRSEASA